MAENLKILGNLFIHHSIHILISDTPILGIHYLPNFQVEEGKLIITFYGTFIYKIKTN